MELSSEIQISVSNFSFGSFSLEILQPSQIIITASSRFKQYHSQLSDSGGFWSFFTFLLCINAIISKIYCCMSNQTKTEPTKFNPSKPLSRHFLASCSTKLLHTTTPIRLVFCNCGRCKNRPPKLRIYYVFECEEFLNRIELGEKKPISPI